ncbi:MAG: molybdenum cofactor biosynthesis protein MoaE [Pirellulales bacterium]|nr:molybdenum cofactor biosynthesis protein MoaE [Planctomycetales bacterium]
MHEEETKTARLVTSAIDPAEVIAAVADPASGATVVFLGTVREMTGDRRTEFLVYECYAEMAEKVMADLERQACERWPLQGCRIVHRLGRLDPAEISVAIAVSSPHRREAFAAGSWIIDEFKRVVPIWKQENWGDGSSEWVHHGECCGHHGAAAHPLHTDATDDAPRNDSHHDCEHLQATSQIVGGEVSRD